MFSLELEVLVFDHDYLYHARCTKERFVGDEKSDFYLVSDFSQIAHPALHF